MNHFSQNLDERKHHDLENVKLKLKMISKNSKSSKVSVDDYISNILGSGLNMSKPSNFNRVESQSAQNLQSDKIRRLNGNDYNHSSANIPTKFSTHLDGTIESDFYLNLPFLYREIINKVKLPTGDLDTQLIYTIFVSSGLSMEILGSIWSVINRTILGKLTILELSVGLAMIALYQKQTMKNGSVSIVVPITWESIISRGEFPIPQVTIDQTDISHGEFPISQVSTDKASISSNGINLSNIFPVGPNTMPTVYTTQKSTDTNNWADFSSFMPKEHQSVTVTSETESFDQPVTNVFPESSKLDIQKQINNQFSSWQNDIKFDTSFSNITSNSDSVDSHHKLDTSIQEKVLTENLPHSINQSVSFNIDSDFGDFQNFSTDQIVSGKSQESSSIHKALIFDRYQVFDSEIADPNSNLINQWSRCLNQCKKIISDTVNVFNRVTDPFIKIEIFSCEKGNLLLSGIIEVYRVTRNIKLSISKTNILVSSKMLVEVLTDIEKYWNDFMLILPDDMQIDVQTRLSKGVQNSNLKNFSDEVSSVDCCGVCLCILDADEGFLSHGLRRYHCPCANLWVNTLDLTLPGLYMPGSVL